MYSMSHFHEGTFRFYPLSYILRSFGHIACHCNLCKCTTNMSCPQCLHSEAIIGTNLPQYIWSQCCSAARHTVGVLKAQYAVHVDARDWGKLTSTWKLPRLRVHTIHKPCRGKNPAKSIFACSTSVDDVSVLTLDEFVLKALLLHS